MELLAYCAFFLTIAMTYAIICLGLNVQWGQTGLFNVGIAGFVGLGGYISAILTTPEAAERIGGFGLPIAAGWAGAMLGGAFGKVGGVYSRALLQKRLLVPAGLVAFTCFAARAESLEANSGAAGKEKTRSSHEDVALFVRLRNRTSYQTGSTLCSAWLRPCCS